MSEVNDKNSKSKFDPRFVVFCIATGLVVLSQFASGIMDWIEFEPIAEGIAKLGYPAYVLKILGTCKIAGAVVLAVPAFPRLKEWAYAGFTFDFLGAASSHALNGDGVGELMPPLIVLGILAASYFTSPIGRKL